MLISIALILAGFFLLMWSADLLVDNASVLASRLGISTFLIGIIIIGFGTSAPEMFVSAVAALDNKGNLALGNALGSNITNIGLVLGSAALIRSLQVTKTTARIDIPIVIFTGIVAIAVVYDGLLSHADGFLLLILLAAYLYSTARFSKGTRPDLDPQDPDPSNLDPHDLDLSAIKHPMAKSTKSAFLYTVVSIILLMVASRMLVDGAIHIAQLLGVGELIIGLTIVAIGTSLPELAAAIAAARKGVHDMFIGNIIGSNVFNTLGVLGLTGALRATEIDVSALWRDFPIMLAFTIMMFIFGLTKGTFSRREGAIMLIGYFAYLIYLISFTITAQS